jgi:hypothetical protein
LTTTRNVETGEQDREHLDYLNPGAGVQVEGEYGRQEGQFAGVTEDFVEDLSDAHIQAVDLAEPLRQDLADGLQAEVRRLRRAAAVRSEKKENG